MAATNSWNFPGCLEKYHPPAARMETKNMEYERGTGPSLGTIRRRVAPQLNFPSRRRHGYGNARIATPSFAVGIWRPDSLENEAIGTRTTPIVVREDSKLSAIRYKSLAMQTLN